MRIATILGVSVVLASVVYTAGVVLREPLMQLAQGHSAPQAGEPSTPHTTNNSTAQDPVSPASLTPTAILPDAASAAAVTVDAAVHVAAVAPDAGTVALAPHATADAGTVHPAITVAGNTPPPGNDAPRPRRPSREAQDQAQDNIATRIAACGVHLGHHAYVHVVYDGATGQASQVEFTGHTLDGNPQLPCVEAAVRGIGLPPFGDAHFEMHYTFMLR